VDHHPEGNKVLHHPREPGVTVSSKISIKIEMAGYPRKSSAALIRALIDLTGTATGLLMRQKPPKVLHPEGNKVDLQPRGNKVDLHPEGSKVDLQPRGNKVDLHPEGNKVDHHPEGNKVLHRPREPGVTVSSKISIKIEMAGYPRKSFVVLTRVLTDSTGTATDLSMSQKRPRVHHREDNKVLHHLEDRKRKQSNSAECCCWTLRWSKGLTWQR
jgi:hypothetical protein